MEEQFSFSDYPIRSEEILAIQNDISNIQDGLDKVVNDNISRNIFLNQASRDFIDFLRQLHQRGEVLHKYTKTLIERENELAIEQKKYNNDIFNLRILNVDLPAETEKLTDLKEKANELSKKRKKITEKIEKLKANIQSMIDEHNSMSTQIDKISLTITDNMYDDMGDTNVNIFIQVQNLRKEMENLTEQIEVTKENIQINEKKMAYINEHIDSITSIKKSLKDIPVIQENISSISKQIKEIRLKQNDERVKSLQYSTELNQICQQQDEVYENLEIQRNFNLKVPLFNSKVIESEMQVNDIKNDLLIQLHENQYKMEQNYEEEKKVQEELEILNNKIIKADKESDLIESKIAEVEILIDDQNREKLKNKKLNDLNKIDDKCNNEKVKNAVLNFNISNPNKFIDEDEIYNEKKKILDEFDQINKEITETNYQIGQIHFKIEYELMRQNVLDAEKYRLDDFQDSAKNVKKQYKSYVTNEKKSKFENDNEYENSVAFAISQRKTNREQQINKQKQEISNLENTVSIKKSRSLMKSQKIEKNKKFYEQSIQNWTKSNEKTEIHTDSISNFEEGFKIEKKLKKNELLKTYIQKVSEAFQSQSRFWDAFEKKDEDGTRESLINWAMQVDQVNKKLQEMSNQSLTKSQSYQNSKTEKSTYLENIDFNTFSYSDL